jgi:anti-anti-sigma factor
MSPRISVERTNDTATVVLTGEQEWMSVERLRHELAKLLDSGDSITVDLRETSFVDSSVAGVLLAAQRDADAREREFGLLLGPETGWAVRRLLQLTQLDRYLSIREA